MKVVKDKIREIVKIVTSLKISVLLTATIIPFMPQFQSWISDLL